MREVKNLEKRVDQITGARDIWLPPWLSAVASAEEIAEWKAIRQSRRGLDCYERTLKFVRKMRQKYPNMTVGFEEELDLRGGVLRFHQELRRQEGLEDDPFTDMVVAQLSEDERADLARAIMSLEKSHGTASLESLPPTQRAAWIKAHELYEKLKGDR